MAIPVAIALFYAVFKLNHKRFDGPVFLRLRVASFILLPNVNASHNRRNLI
jgi:hypothetical protein